MRIVNHPILTFSTDQKIPFTFNNKQYHGYPQDTIASALHASGITILSYSQKYHRPRGFFCGIGKCSSCLMQVNGIPNIRTCITPLQPNLTIHTQDQHPPIPTIPFHNQPLQSLTPDILIIGAGPAGLSAANEAADHDAHVLLVDENPHLGGQLIKQTHKFFGSKHEQAGTRGITIATDLQNTLQKHQKNHQATILTNSTVIGYYEKQNKHHQFAIIQRHPNLQTTLYHIHTPIAIFATGAMENMLLFPGNDLPGVYGAGAVQTLMNVHGVKPGNTVLMIGAGNVGLIVAYQLLQANIPVTQVVEAAPTIGGYHVHAAKLRRCGIPIHTSHSIKEVHGTTHVEGATIHQLNSNWQPIPNTETTINCDTICLAVGLTPSTRLLTQTGATMEHIPEAGGFIALHNQNMETTIPGIYTAGDASGIEEASTAMLEGKIAALAAAIKLQNTTNTTLLKQYQHQLKQLRAGPFGEKPRLAKQKITTLRKKIL